MGDLMKGLSNQGAQDSSQNVQWWLDQAEAAKAKKAAGQPLNAMEQRALDAEPAWSKKGATMGVTASKYSASTGVPDLTDAAAQSAKMNQALMLISGRGQRASQQNGLYGDSMLGSL